MLATALLTLEFMVYVQHCQLCMPS